MLKDVLIQFNILMLYLKFMIIFRIFYSRENWLVLHFSFYSITNVGRDFVVFLFQLLSIMACFCCECIE